MSSLMNEKPKVAISSYTEMENTPLFPGESSKIKSMHRLYAPFNITTQIKPVPKLISVFLNVMLDCIIVDGTS